MAVVRSFPRTPAQPQRHSKADRPFRTDTLLQALGDVVLVVDHLGKCRHYRGAARSPFFGLPNGDIRGRHIHALFQPKVAARLRAIIDGQTIGGTVKFKYTHALKGERRHVEARVIELAPREVLVALRDVTARVRLASLERESERLRSQIAHSARADMVGGMTACLMHELAQPLSAIVFNAEAARRQPSGSSDNDDMRAIIDDLYLNAERARELVKHLREFLGDSQRDSVRINTLVHRILHLADSAIHAHGIQIALELAPSLSTVAGDRVELEELLWTLMLNAIGAVRNRRARGGRIVVRTARADSGILISVRDSGTGFTGGDSQKQFEPFFSGKPGGTEAGLRIRSIVASHGGRMSVEYHAEGGATLRVFLPSDDRAHKLLTPNRNRAQGTSAQSDFLPKALKKANRAGGEFLLGQLDTAMTHLDLGVNIPGAANRTRCVTVATAILAFVDRSLPRLSLASAMQDIIRSRRDALQMRLHSARSEVVNARSSLQERTPWKPSGTHEWM